MGLKKPFLFLTFAVFVFACSKDKVTGSGNVISQQRGITGFTGVVVNGSTKAFINIDTGFAVTVTGYENLLPHLETNIVNSVLQVGYKNNITVSNDNTEVHVTLPILNYILTNGDGDMAVSGDVKGSDHLKAIINGSANISVEKGAANEFDGEISGDGNILALGFQCKDAYVKISGNGSVEISVGDKLDVTISGDGKVYYRGSPAITTHISGNGQVIPK